LKNDVRRHCYVRIRGKNTLAHQLSQIVSATSEIFKTLTMSLVQDARPVPVIVGRKVSRMINLDVVLGNIDSEVRFAVVQNEKVPNGVAIHGRYLGGVGLTMFEWLHVPGFLETIVRCEAIRMRIREAMVAWF
jgi:hypothetical protein